MNHSYFFFFKTVHPNEFMFFLFFNQCVKPLYLSYQTALTNNLKKIHFCRGYPYLENCWGKKVQTCLKLIKIQNIFWQNRTKPIQGQVVKLLISVISTQLWAKSPNFRPKRCPMTPTLPKKWVVLCHQTFLRVFRVFTKHWQTWRKSRPVREHGGGQGRLTFA